MTFEHRVVDTLLMYFYLLRVTGCVCFPSPPTHHLTSLAAPAITDFNSTKHSTIVWEHCRLIVSIFQELRAEHVCRARTTTLNPIRHTAIVKRFCSTLDVNKPRALAVVGDVYLLSRSVGYKDDQATVHPQHDRQTPLVGLIEKPLAPTCCQKAPG